MEEKDKFIIKALEAHGSFFHRKCIEKIASVENVQVIEKEYPITYMQRDTKIDIVALHDSNVVTHFIVECKKTNNDFKTWIFFQDSRLHSDDESLILKHGKPLLLIDAYLSSEDKIGAIRHVKTHIIPRDKNAKEIISKVCYDAYEVKFDPQKDNGKINFNNAFNAAKKDKIEEACFQVVIGCRGFASQKCEKYTHKDTRDHFFIPIILTTANIYTCDVDLVNIDLEKGEVINSETAKINEEKWVAYNYRSKYVDDSVPVVLYPNSRNGIDNTMTIYIVNSKHLSDFFDKMRFAGLFRTNQDQWSSL